MIQGLTFLINGYELESMGFFNVIVDVQGPQTVIAPYGLMLQGLAYSINEVWAPSFLTPTTSWVSGTTVVSTTWVSGSTVVTTGWTGQSF